MTWVYATTGGRKQFSRLRDTYLVQYKIDGLSFGACVPILHTHVSYRSLMYRSLCDTHVYHCAIM